MRVALAFWGLTRSLKYTIGSIKKNILDILKKENIQYDIYIHTYSLNKAYSNTRAGERNIALNNNEYKLLHPYYSFVDSQSHIMNKLKLSSYRTHRDPWNTNYESVNYFILSMFSKYKVTKFIEAHNKNNYDYIIFLRPDVKYLNKFDTKFFNLVNDNTICIPNFQTFAGFNDRFCITTYKNGLLYGKLYNNLLEYSKKHPLHSETFMGYYMKKIYGLKILFIPFYFNRVRSDGREVNDTPRSKLILLKKNEQIKKINKQNEINKQNQNNK